MKQSDREVAFPEHGLIVIVFRIITMSCHTLLGPRPTIGGHCSVGTGGEYKIYFFLFLFLLQHSAKFRPLWSIFE